MLHIYTFGKMSKQFLVLTPSQAKTMDDFTECFFRSQSSFYEKNGYRWTPDESLIFLVPNDDPELLNRYNKLTNNVNRQHAIRNKLFDILHINLMDEEMDDFLVKRI